MIWAADEKPAFVERLVEWTQAGVPLASASICADTAWSGIIVGFCFGAGLVGMAWVVNRRLG
jgi:hypothetical protein